MANDNTLNVEITSSVDGLKKGLVQADKGLKQFDTASKKVTKSTGRMAKTVKVNAVPAMTSFSQVMQDAPYGIRGVANNIQQLTMQMGHLSAKTGGIKGALKSMVGSLIGPAGVLLAVSLVTSLLVSYGDEIGNFIKGTDNAKKAIEDFTKEIENLGKTLSRLKIAKKLGEAMGKDTAEISLKTLSLLRDQQKIQESQVSNALKLFRDYEKEAKSFGLFSSSKISKKEHAELKKLSADYDGFVASVTKTKLAIRDLEEELSTVGEVMIGGDGDDKGFGKTIEENTTAGMFAFANMIAAGRSFQGAFSDIMIKTTESTKVQISEMALAFEGLVTKIKGVAESGLFNAVADIAFSIGDAIGGGINVLKAVGNTMLDTLGSILVQFGELTLAYGIANLALFTAITSGPNPLSAGAAIAAGAALIAIGGAVKAFSKNALSGGDSDSGASSGGGNSSFSGGSTSGFSGGSGAGGTYVFEIAGTKLVGVLKNTLDRNRALGGSLGFTS